MSAYDCLFGYNLLMIHFDGADNDAPQATDSIGGKTITYVGNPVLKTDIGLYGKSALKLDGSQYATLASHADFDLAYYSFTVEVEFYLESIAATQGIYCRGASTLQGWRIAYDQPSGKLICSFGQGSYVLTSLTTIQTSKWYRVGVSRNSNGSMQSWSLWLDDICEATLWIGNNSCQSAADGVVIGALYTNGTSKMTGRIRDIRYGRSIGRYNTQPSLGEPFPFPKDAQWPDAYTDAGYLYPDTDPSITQIIFELLCEGSNGGAITDTLGHALTGAGGTPPVLTTTNAIFTSTVGNFTGGYVTTPYNANLNFTGAGTGWMIKLMYFPVNTTGTQGILSMTSGNGGFRLYFDATNGLQFDLGNEGSGFNQWTGRSGRWPVAGQWNFIYILSDNAGNKMICLNGYTCTQSAATVSNTALTFSQALCVGAIKYDGTSPCNGYVKDLRIYKAPLQFEPLNRHAPFCRMVTSTKHSMARYDGNKIAVPVSHNIHHNRIVMTNR